MDCFKFKSLCLPPLQINRKIIYILAVSFAMRLSLIPLFLLLLAPLVFSISADDFLQSDYFKAFPVVVMLVVIMLAATKMAAVSFSMPQLDAWVKIETRELIAAILLLAIVISVVGASGYIVEIITSALAEKQVVSQSADYFDYAASTVAEQQAAAVTAYEYVIKGMSRLRAVSTYGVSYSFGFLLMFGYGFTRYGGLYPLSSALQAGASGLINVILIYESIGVLLAFFKAYGLSVLLPLGFILRVIPFSRQVGTTLIAISLGVYLFFPLSIIIISIFHGQMGGIEVPTLDLDAVSPPKYNANTIIESICEYPVIRVLLSMGEIIYATIQSIPCGPFFEVCFFLSIWIYQLMVAFFGTVTSIGLLALDQILASAGAGFSVDAAYEAVFDFLYQVNSLVVISYIDVLLIGLMTVTATRSVAVALGGEAYISGMERLI
ncbi:MAG: hypothetical protein V1492_01975 [Candidatus Micrarchaeota archaeon]